MIDSFSQYPDYLRGQGKVVPYESVIEDFSVSLKDYSIKRKEYQISAQFPLVDPNKIGKKWIQSYFVAKKIKDDFIHNTLGSLDINSGKQQFT